MELAEVGFKSCNLVICSRAPGGQRVFCTPSHPSILQEGKNTSFWECPCSKGFIISDAPPPPLNLLLTFRKLNLGAKDKVIQVLGQNVALPIETEGHRRPSVISVSNNQKLGNYVGCKSTTPPPTPPFCFLQTWTLNRLSISL